MENEPLYYKKPSQLRGEKAVNNIFEAARSLILTNETDKFTARNLATRSGYSVGAIYRYFEKIDDIYSHLFIERRKLVCLQLIEKIQAFPPAGNGHQMLEILVEHALQSWNSHNHSVIRMLCRQFFKRAKNPEQFNTVIDMLIPSLSELARQNQTRTIKLMSEFEWKMALRSFQGVLNSPFLEGDIFAGTEEHKKIVYQIGGLLFLK